MTYICVVYLTIIGSDNGLSPSRRQAIIWTNAGILLIRPLGPNFSDILIKIDTFSLKKMHLKMSSAKRRPFCLGLIVFEQNMSFCSCYFIFMALEKLALMLKCWHDFSCDSNELRRAGRHILLKNHTVFSLQHPRTELHICILAASLAPGDHFTNDIVTKFLILTKILITVVSRRIVWSQWNFAHTKTA